MVMWSAMSGVCAAIIVASFPRTLCLQHTSRNSELENSGAAEAVLATATSEMWNFLNAQNATKAQSVNSSMSKERVEELKKQQSTLKALLTKLKSDIGGANKHETESKGENEKMLQRTQERLDQHRHELEQKNLTAWRREFITNQTKSEEKQVEYLTKGRELQHHMFHSNLKMSHGLMSRVKAVLDVYDGVMEKGKVDESTRKALEAVSSSLPKVQ